MMTTSPPPDPDRTSAVVLAMVRLTVAALVGAVAAVAASQALPLLRFNGEGVDLAFAGGAVAGLIVGWRRPAAVRALVIAAVILFALPLAFHGVAGFAAFVGVVLAVVGGVVVLGRPPGPPAAEAPLGRHLWPAVAVAVVAVVVYSVYAVERHRRFGSGSWDYGCYVHNAWLFAAGDAFSLSARSAVLGDVAFWGGTNHFMPSLVFTAPIAWLMQWTGDTSWLAVAQNVVVAATAVPLALLARRHGLGPWSSTALVTAFLLHVGTQAALLFDVHEIAPVPLLLTTSALLILDERTPRRTVALVALLLLCAGTKESSWLYVGGFGTFMVVSSPPWRRPGVLVVVASVIAFVVVVGVIQPALLEDGSAGMIHAARFRGVGDTAATSLVDAALSMVLHPGRVVAAFVYPTEKLATLVTSVSGFGWAPLASGAGLFLGAPNLIERFLADKREMWGLAFHYGLVTAGWMAIASASVLGRLRARLAGPRSDVVVAAVIVVGVVVGLTTSPRTPDLARLEQPYFASADDVARFERALAVIRADDDAAVDHGDDHGERAVVAQNHFLPHLALRRHIWLPEARFIERADLVILDDRASPWPHDRRHVTGLVRRLEGDERFEVAFSEGSTRVFRRRR